MPIYEYRCDACRCIFRKLLSFQALSECQTCQRCGSQQTQRLLSRFSRLKSEGDAFEAMTDSFATFRGEADSPEFLRQIKDAAGDEIGEEAERDFDEAASAPSEDTPLGNNEDSP